QPEGGADTVYADVDFALPENVENLVLLGSSGRTGAGNDGDNFVYSSGGNDAIDGRGGVDTAVYSGAVEDYEVTFSATAHTFTVADQRQGAPDGTDIIQNIEKLQFADGTINLSMGPSNSPPIAQDGTAIGNEDTPIHGQAVATDVDNPNLTY